MADDFVAARLDPIEDLRVLTQYTGIGVVRSRQAHLVQQVEEVPLADAVPVIAPGEIPVRLRCVQRGAIASKALTEAKYLDIVAHAHCQPLPAWPFIFRPLRQRGIGIAPVLAKFHCRSSLNACQKSS